MTVLSSMFTPTSAAGEPAAEPMRNQAVADFVELLIKAGQYLGLKLELGSISYQLFALSSILLVAIVSFLIVKFVLHFKVLRFVAKSNNTWDDCLLDAGVFRRIARIVPGIIVYSTYSLFFSPDEKIYSLLANLSAIYLLFTVWRTLSASLTAVESIYSKSQLARKAPITGFIQVAKLLFTLILIFLMLSLLLGKSPIFLLSGLTAIAAVLLLIFRDTILGFVAGIQIAANRMFNTGDWIAMPKY